MVTFGLRGDFWPGVVYDLGELFGTEVFLNIVTLFDHVIFLNISYLLFSVSFSTFLNFSIAHLQSTP